MSGHVVHAKTSAQLQQFLTKPAHAVLFVGPQGVGKGTIAVNTATQMLAIAPDTLHKYQYFMHIQPKNGTVPIEFIRNLSHFLQLKTAGDKPIRRIAIIEYADQMTTEAQNALLKMLEEPPADTVLVLTANNTHALLPTILSRLQHINVHTPLESDIREHFASIAPDAKALDQAFFLSGGLPGLLHALLQKSQDHPLWSAVDQAKTLLQQSSFERLAAVDTLSKQKDDVVHILHALQRIAQTGVNQAAKRQDAARIKRWHGIIEAVHDTLETLEVHGNTKLALTNLMLSM
jgi:replication-associated recombination protein RarA